VFLKDVCTHYFAPFPLDSARAAKNVKSEAGGWVWSAPRDIINEAAPKQRHPNGFNPFLTGGGLLLIELPPARRRLMKKERPREQFFFVRRRQSGRDVCACCVRDTLFAAKAASERPKKLILLLGRA